MIIKGQYWNNKKLKLYKLRKIKRIIYKITNNINEKCYIGKTKRNFYDRYVNGKWWENTDNICLKRAVKKYGLENFSVEILEKNIETRANLSKLERHYIKKFNALNPNGYNFETGGDKGKQFCQDTIDKMIDNSSKEYHIIDYNGRNYYIKNLKKFAIDNNLDVSGLCMMVNKKVYTSQGFTLPENKNKIKNGSMWIWNPDKEFKLISPNDKIFCIKNGELKDFCKEQNLNYSTVIDMIGGRIKTTKRWKLYGNKTSRYKKIALINKNGVIIIGKDLPEISKNLNSFLNNRYTNYELQSRISRVIKGKRKTFLDFKVLSVEYI